MTEEATKSTKKASKSLPLLIFLIGFALIVCGFLMQIGYFGSDDSTVPEQTESSSSKDSEEASAVDDAVTVDESATADASTVDFSVHDIQDNITIPVKKDEKYTYNGAFAMIVEELSVKCDDSGTCGSDGDKVVLKFSTVEGANYTLEFTPSESTKTLIDVPVEIKEWHSDYVVMLMKR